MIELTNWLMVFLRASSMLAVFPIFSARNFPTQLRLALGADASFSVVKNTLTKIAAKDAGLSADFSQLLVGPSAMNVS